METGYYPRKRNRSKGRYSPLVADVIARNYKRLREDLEVSDRGNYLSISHEDIFADTILVVSHDIKATQMTEIELLDFFKYRYNMVQYQTINDAKYITNIEHANNLKEEETA